MSAKKDLETAEAGYVINLDPPPRSKSEDVEYLYLTPGAAGEEKTEQKLDPTQRPQPIQSEPQSGTSQSWKGQSGKGQSGKTQSGKSWIVPVAPSVVATPDAQDRSQSDGFQIAHYRIQRAIGRGGMGDVYLAKDQRLGRPVAIKLLRADHHPTEERIRRMQQEARAVCSLNHPNIVTIHEIGEEDGAPYIVSEYIEGNTLRDLLAPHGLRPDHALEITLQIAGALSAVHQMGIVHRDIKPENVMVRIDGYVKVLDFGLAKLSDGIDICDPRAGATDLPADVVMGTVCYMSPEQAGGHVVDPRSDIFSLGILLYELLTGRKPFDGKSPKEILTAITTEQPPPLARYWKEEILPFQSILDKALSKNREDRYATMVEMGRALRALRDEVALKALERRAGISQDSSTSGVQIVSLARRATQFGLGNLKALHTTRPQLAAKRTENLRAALEPAKELAKTAKRVAQGYAEKIIPAYEHDRPPDAAAAKKTGPPTKGRKLSERLKAWLALGVLFVLAICATYLKEYLLDGGDPAFNRVLVTRLTANGQIGEAALSPDGRFLIFSQTEEGGAQRLLLRNIKDNINRQLLPARNVLYKEIIFSRDGNSVYLLLNENHDRADSNLYRMPSLGGLLERVPINVASSFDLSPKGDSLAFIRTLSDGRNGLSIVDVGSGEERLLATRNEPNGFLTGGLAWADQQTIICGASYTDQAGVRYESLVAVGVDDGAERTMSPKRWKSIGKIASLSSGAGLALLGVAADEQEEQLWIVSSSGDARQVTSDFHEYSGLSVSRDGRRIAAVKVEDPLDIWIASSSDFTRMEQITNGRGRYFSASWLPDGQIVADSQVDGDDAIWKLTPNGHNAVQLTPKKGHYYTPVSAPDGQRLIVQGLRDGVSNLWRINSGSGPGGEPGRQEAVQLTHGSTDANPQLSPDGRWVFYESFVGERWAIWRTSIDSGSPQLFLASSISHLNSPTISPDGQFAAIRETNLKSRKSQIIVASINSRTPSLTFDLPATAGDVIRWAEGGFDITYVDNRSGASEIWSQPIGGGPPRQLTKFGAGVIQSFVWSKDGRRLMVTRGVKTRDAVLISEVN
jgi:serine/threonine protein kinase/Tol biopolymer transport system component